LFKQLSAIAGLPFDDPQLFASVQLLVLWLLLAQALHCPQLQLGVHVAATQSLLWHSSPWAQAEQMPLSHPQEDKVPEHWDSVHEPVQMLPE
jgi:hypothetical protein